MIVTSYWVVCRRAWYQAATSPAKQLWRGKMWPPPHLSPHKWRWFFVPVSTADLKGPPHIPIWQDLYRKGLPWLIMCITHCVLATPMTVSVQTKTRDTYPKKISPASTRAIHSKKFQVKDPYKVASSSYRGSTLQRTCLIAWELRYLKSQASNI